MPPAREDHPYRQPDAPRTPDCPRCAAPLTDERVEDRALLRCERCDGLWLPRDLFLDALIEPELQRALQGMDRPARDVVDGPALPCPRCRRAMDRGCYASSSIAIDVCPPHGVWLDASEITRILRFSDASRSGATSERAPALPDAVELHRAIFPRSPFWDRLGALLSAREPWRLRRR